MELTFSELNDFLLRISTGSEIIRVNKGSEFIHLLFKYPSNFINLRAISVYNEAYDEALSEGLMPAEKLEQLILDRKIFTQEDQDNIAKLESKLKAQKVLLSKTTKVRSRADRIKNLIKDIENDIISIKSKKYSTLMMSAENQAENDKNKFLCSQCTFDLNGSLYWESTNAFLNEKDTEFRETVLGLFIDFCSGISTNIIRYIARSNLWRIRYINSQKVSDPLFGVPTTEYTNDQLNLVYWSNYYQNIYEMMPDERPPDNIIEDDEALDAFMASYYKERQKESSARRGKNKSTGKLSAFDGEEVIVTQFDDMAQDIEYDKPREAQRIKDRADIKKKVRRRRN